MAVNPFHSGIGTNNVGASGSSVSVWGAGGGGGASSGFFVNTSSTYTFTNTAPNSIIIRSGTTVNGCSRLVFENSLGEVAASIFLDDNGQLCHTGDVSSDLALLLSSTKANNEGDNLKDFAGKLIDRCSNDIFRQKLKDLIEECGLELE